jgi:DNA-binding transcriptional regulator of glucitol operon
LLSPRWLVRHILAVVLVVAFCALGWWQVRRAAAGNVLSYGYAVEWPVFAAFVVALWVREVRAELRPANRDEPPAPAPQPSAPGYVPFDATVRAQFRTVDDDDPELRAYNDYLAWLAANPGRRPDEYRKGSLS